MNCTLLILLLITILLLSILVINYFRNNDNDKNKVKKTIHKFQKALQNGDVDTIVNLYYDNNSHIITNRPGNFEKSVWPVSNNKDKILVGKPIKGLHNLKKYQEFIFNNYDLTHVTSDILSLNLYNDNAVATIFGTHKVFKKNNGKIDKSNQINVQAQEIWNLKKSFDGNFYVTSIAFIDHEHVFKLN